MAQSSHIATVESPHWVKVVNTSQTGRELDLGPPCCVVAVLTTKPSHSQGPQLRASYTVSVAPCLGNSSAYSLQYNPVIFSIKRFWWSLYLQSRNWQRLMFVLHPAPHPPFSSHPPINRSFLRRRSPLPLTSPMPTLGRVRFQAAVTAEEWGCVCTAAAGIKNDGRRCKFAFVNLYMRKRECLFACLCRSKFEQSVH